jgi:hypothetical protein
LQGKFHPRVAVKSGTKNVVAIANCLQTGKESGAIKFSGDGNEASSAESKLGFRLFQPPQAFLLG